MLTLRYIHKCWKARRGSVLVGKPCNESEPIRKPKPEKPDFISEKEFQV